MWYCETFQLFWGMKWVCHCWEPRIVLGFLVGCLDRWIEEYWSEMVWKWLRPEVGRPSVWFKKNVYWKNVHTTFSLKKKYCVTPVLETDISEGLFVKSTPDSIFISVISVLSFAHVSWSQIPFSCRFFFFPSYLKACLKTRIVFYFIAFGIFSYFSVWGAELIYLCGLNVKSTLHCM